MDPTPEITRPAELLASYFGHLWASCIVRQDNGLVDAEATRKWAEAKSAKGVVASAHTEPANADGTATGRYSWRIEPESESMRLSINRSTDSCRDEIPFAWACLIEGQPGYTSIPVVRAEFTTTPDCCWEDMDLVVTGSPLAHTRHWLALLEMLYALGAEVDSVWVDAVLQAWHPDVATVQSLQAEREIRRGKSFGVLGPEDEWEGKVLSHYAQTSDSRICTQNNKITK